MGNKQIYIMEKNKVDMYIVANAEKFSSDKLGLIRMKLLELDDDKFTMLQCIELKNTTTMLLFSLFLGHWGVDRFMVGETGLGVLKLITCGGAGVWTVIDWFLVTQYTKDYNFNKLMMTLGY